jgi:hypothetical protein
MSPRAREPDRKPDRSDEIMEVAGTLDRQLDELNSVVAKLREILTRIPGEEVTHA